MKNVTITLDEATALWARIHAAEQNISVSRLVGEMLAQRMRDLSEYDHAMRTWLARPPVKLSRSGTRYPGRQELHDRARLR
ncbi:MAG: CopG family transcriptional regulator [Betaproteobacteria bacterium]|nr:CopG family transcriptional regulator [Betaproteobacteria bacterium]